MNCPICDSFDEKDNFQCPDCGRENICGKHYNVDYLVCEECAKAMTEEDSGEQEDESVSAAPTPVDRTGKNPFHFVKIKCPVCGTVSEQWRFKIKIYAEKKPDLDKHPTNYVFRDKDFSSFHPPLYYFWLCSSCKFTESYIEYENPGKQVWSNFRDLKDQFRNHLEEKNQQKS